MFSNGSGMCFANLTQDYAEIYFVLCSPDTAWRCTLTSVEGVSAEAVHAEALALRREPGELHGVAVSLRNPGRARYAEGDQAQGTSQLEDSLALRRVLDARLGVADSLDRGGRQAAH